MLAVSQRFLDTIVNSHRVTIEATIVPPTGVPIVAQVIGGTLRADRDARVRRQGTLEVAFDLALAAASVRTLPFGGYVLIERGILYADGTSERPRVATMRVENVSWSGAQGQATLELADRMAQVQDEPFVTPYAPTGLTPAQAAEQVVRDVFGSTIAYHVSASGGAALVDTTYDQDRAQALGDLAAAINADAIFDAAGDFVLRPRPGDPAATTPVWEFEVGEGGTLIDTQENLDRSVVRNGVAVRGIAALDASPVFALAVDGDPTSPTRWGGPFGKVATIVSSSSVQTQAQADATAASLLNLRLGLARSVTIRGVPNPALEPDDVVLACYPDGREERLRINSLALPLEPEGSLTIVATGHYRPEALTRSRPRRALRIFGAERAQRELEGATVA